MNRRTNKPPFITVPFQNRGGTISYRVTGTVGEKNNKKRIQKNFSTREEAEGKMIELNAAAYQGESSPGRYAQTTLSDDKDLREAEVAWDRLREKVPDGSLITAVDYYLANAGQVIVDGKAEQIVVDFIEARRSRGNKENTLTGAESILKKFLRVAAITNISQFTKDKAEKFVMDTTVSVRTRRDRKDQLYNWAEFLVKQKYLSKNFISEIDRPKVTYDGKVTTFTAKQILDLLKRSAVAPVGRRKAAGKLLPYFAVCSLSGIRPDEAKRLGPDWAWFSKENHVITGFRSKLSDSPRTVEIDPKLVEILEYCRKHGHAPSDFTVKAFNQIRQDVGMFKSWDNDILRHSYASHHYAYKRDMNYLEKNMGNSEDVLKRSYLDQTILAKAGEKYCGINLAQILERPDTLNAV